jgi:threonyl-tRNA synthetase
VDEVVRVIDLAQFMLRTFGFKRYEIDLSVRDPQHTDQYAGRDDEWDQAEQSLAQALKAKELPFTRREGEAVFYGPKIDIKLLDALGRGWQGPTIQFDFNLPGRLGVEYVGQDGRTHNVVMIHRTVLGALGRFIGTVVEHYAGAMPVWLAPVQVSVLPVRDTDEAYAARVVDDLTRSGVRAELVGSHQKLGYRIRAKTMEKVPYILVVGAKEEESGSVSVRKRKVGDRGVVPLNEFIGIVRNEIETKAFED